MKQQFNDITHQMQNNGGGDSDTYSPKKSKKQLKYSKT